LYYTDKITLRSEEDQQNHEKSLPEPDQDPAAFSVWSANPLFVSAFNYPEKDLG
jgi:hypothetical protein